MMSLTPFFAVVPLVIDTIAHDPSHAAGYAHGLLVGGIAGLFVGGTFGMVVMACLVASRPEPATTRETLESFRSLNSRTRTVGNSGPFTGRLAGRIRPTQSVASAVPARVS